MNNQIDNELEQNRATCTTEQIEPIKSQPTQIVSTNCSACMSGRLDEIHLWRPTHTLRELSERLKNECGVDVSKDALSRHFMHYTKQLQVSSTESLLAKFNRDVESVSEHQKKVLFLCKISFDHIIERLDSGTLKLGIDDFEKMIKLYYSVLRDPDSAGDESIMAIFQRASNEFGCQLEQGVLIKAKKTLE